MESLPLDISKKKIDKIWADEETLEKVSKICRDSCNPIDDKRGTIDYRTKVAGVLFKRATLLAADRIRGN